MDQSKMSKGTMESGDNCLRIIILGKAGIGKSTFANSMYGEKKFKTSMFDDGGTTRCQIESRRLDQAHLVIADTPGFFSQSRLNLDVIRELGECFDLLGRGPYVFILVLSLNERFTGDEDDTMEFLDAVYGTEVFKYMMVVFSWLDNFDDYGLQGNNIDGIIPPSARQILSKCGNRYTSINNKAPREERDGQVQNIIGSLQSMVTVNNSPYTKQILQRAQNSIGMRIGNLESRRRQRLVGDGGKGYRAISDQAFGNSGDRWCFWRCERQYCCCCHCEDNPCYSNACC